MTTPTLEDVQEMNEALRIIEGLAKKYKIPNILDKNKYREFQTAGALQHSMFTSASGGKNSEDTYGADAHDANGKKCEYKSYTLVEECRTIKPKGAVRKLISRFHNKQEIAFVGVYNGAYTHEAIDRYRKVTHYFTAYIGTQPLLTIKVPTEEIIRQLTHNLETSTKKTTNANSVRVTGHIGDFDVVWRNEELIREVLTKDPSEYIIN